VLAKLADVDEDDVGTHEKEVHDGLPASVVATGNNLFHDMHHPNHLDRLTEGFI
jgi:hypothetical protein